VFLPDGARVGELDEEMVYESRPGETFLLGATTWRIEDITHDRVVVTPAPGQPGKMPFWHGDGPGRPLELGRALGTFTRELREIGPVAALERLGVENRLDPRAAANLVAYLDEQGDATGAVPDDRTIVVERFTDEIGDWRVCILSPFGAQVHAPWAMALQHKLSELWGRDVELMWSDDGIVVRLPEAVDELPLDALAIDPDEIDDLLVAQLPGTALFASRFRECAARALLLPRRRPDRRTPLWQQRQRSADLLAVAGKYPSFPLLLETTRECLNDVFDVPALRAVLRDIRGRAVRLVAVDTPRASPFAQSLLFGWVAVYMYEGDAPLAERRAAALALDRDLLADLLGAEELRELLDPGALADLELELQCLVDGRRARDPDELHDLLRRLGPLSLPELAARAQPPAEALPAAAAALPVGSAGAPGVAERSSAAGAGAVVVDGPTRSEAGEVADGSNEAGVERAAVVGAWAERLVVERRAFWGSVGGEQRLAAAEDAARLRDALGVSLPMGLPTAFTEPVDDPLVELVARHARTHGPFLVAEVTARLGAAADQVVAALAGLEADGRVLTGEFRPGGIEREHCDAGVLRQLRRRSLAKLRHEVEPVEGSTFARFLQQWHGIGSKRTGIESLVDVLGQLQGASLPASALESEVLPARLRDYRSADLDELCTAGELVWAGAGAIGATDGRLVLAFRDQAALLLARPGPEAADTPGGPLPTALLDWLGQRGASFWPELVQAAQQADQPYDDASVLAALWDLVWAGLVTNDSLAPVRASIAGKVRRAAGQRRSQRGRLSRLGPPQAAGRWSLVAPLLVPERTPTEVAHARAGQLLERHGVITREGALAEGVEGGFAGVYPVLRALEERGRARRGYFVAGLGAAQFALPGAVDRLRASRPSAADRIDDGDEVPLPVVLAATDPAQPYGGTLPWPESAGRPARASGALVVLGEGEALCFVERGGRSLWTFPAAEGQPGWVEALAQRVRSGRARQHEVQTVDGEPARTSPWAEPLRRAGYVDGYRGLVMRR
jgi:ATP-dependent Lhr-like helicase